MPKEEGCPVSNVDALEAFVDEGLGIASAAGYPAIIFRRMRREHGTVEAISKLVCSAEIQSGFLELKRHKLLDWSIEAIVLKFPERFSAQARQCAEFRLKHGGDKKLRRRR